MNAIPIRRHTPLSDADREIADCAFNLWLSSAFRGSPEDALFAAVEMFRGQCPAHLFLVAKHPMVSPFRRP
jgi:hypothetical protein